MTEHKKIYETSDYKIFKYLKGNRAIHEPWVRKLAELIKENDLQIPIIVDDKMIVQDGQHRLEAYKIVGLPVKYIIKNKFGLDEVRAINQNSKKWTLTDFMMSFVKLGNKDYQLLEWFVKTYEMPILASVAMLNGKGFVDSKTIKGYKEGEYEIVEMSDDIDYISAKELVLQRKYGYRVERKKYSELFNNNFIKLKTFINLINGCTIIK